MDKKKHNSVPLIPVADSCVSATGPDGKPRRHSGKAWPEASCRPAPPLHRAAPAVVAILDRVARRWTELTGRRLRIFSGAIGARRAAQDTARYTTWVAAGQPEPSRPGGGYVRATMSFRPVSPVDASYLQAGFGVRIDTVASCDNALEYKLLGLLFAQAGMHPVAPIGVGSPDSDVWVLSAPFMGVATVAVNLMVESLDSLDTLKRGDINALKGMAKSTSIVEVAPKIACYLTGTHSGVEQQLGLVWARMVLEKPWKLAELPPPGTMADRARIIDYARTIYPQLVDLPRKKITDGLLLAQANLAGTASELISMMSSTHTSE